MSMSLLGGKVGGEEGVCVCVCVRRGRSGRCCLRRSSSCGDARGARRRELGSAGVAVGDGAVAALPRGLARPQGGPRWRWAVDRPAARPCSRANAAPRHPATALSLQQNPPSRAPPPPVDDGDVQRGLALVRAGRVLRRPARLRARTAGGGEGQEFAPRSTPRRARARTRGPLPHAHARMEGPACACARERACVRACVRTCVRACAPGRGS